MEVFLLKRTKTRDPFYDNARFLLVMFVVIGHFFSPIRSNYEIIEELNNMLSLFRMPALILITGFFSKGFLRPGYIEKIFKRILIPYLIFQFAFGYYYYFLYDRSEVNIDFLNPQYTLWFLLSLFIWNMLLFIFTRIKYPILIAFLIGIIIGYSDRAGFYFSIHRTFVFFPFFLLGFYLRKEHFEWVKKAPAKIFGIVGFIIVWFVVDNLFTTREASLWFSGRYSYDAMEYIRWDIGLVRALIYVLSLIVAFSFLAFVPKKKTFFTSLGMRTAYIYILHAAIIRTLYEYYLNDWVSELWHYYVILIFGILLSFILASRPVVFLTKPFITGSIADFAMRPISKVTKVIKKKFNKQISFIKQKLLLSDNNVNKD